MHFHSTIRVQATLSLPINANAVPWLFSSVICTPNGESINGGNDEYTLSESWVPPTSPLQPPQMTFPAKRATHLEGHNLIFFSQCSRKLVTDRRNLSLPVDFHWRDEDFHRSIVMSFARLVCRLSLKKSLSSETSQTIWNRTDKGSTKTDRHRFSWNFQDCKTAVWKDTQA